MTDLSRNDFTLYDNGKPVPIDEFSAVSLQRAPAETLPPNTFSNRVGGQPIITVVLLDGLNTSFQDQSWARTEVVRFLEKLRPEDRVAIFMLGEHLYVLQNFTSDPQILLAALRNAKIRNPREVAGSAPPQSNPDEADTASVNVMGSPVSASVDPSAQSGCHIERSFGAERQLRAPRRVGRCGRIRRRRRRHGSDGSDYESIPGARERPLPS